jgi:hypothetical protein
VDENNQNRIDESAAHNNHLPTKHSPSTNNLDYQLKTAVKVPNSRLKSVTGRRGQGELSKLSISVAVLPRWCCRPDDGLPYLSHTRIGYQVCKYFQH